VAVLERTDDNMTTRYGRNGYVAAKQGINMAKLIGLAATVVLNLLQTVPSCAQDRPENAGATFSPAFEVASIKPVESDSFAPMVTINFEPDRYVASNCSLQMLIKEAYGTDDYRILGGPQWINSARYEIEARIDVETYRQLQKLNYDQLKLAHQQMVQALLSDRFKLEIHQDTKVLPIYSLVITKNGPKLREASLGETYANGAQDPGGRPLGPHTVGNKSSLKGSEWIVVLTGQAASLDVLANAVRVYLGRTIVDNSGLKGQYDFQITFNWPFDSGDDPKQQPDNDTPPQYSERTLFDAFRDQLGLKLVPQKGPAEVLVVDHVERPSGN
jgi:uncharacterized protein (TIGR03435 family)